MAGATQLSDDGRPNNTGRRPSGFATIGPSGGRALGASCPAIYRARAPSRSPKGADDGQRAAYKLPTSVEVLAAIPKTGAGKIRRVGLRDRAAAKEE
jgi:acyl-CoA synthetase (AMP-forming)/AMP-acid ligase II